MSLRPVPPNELLPENEYKVRLTSYLPELFIPTSILLKSAFFINRFLICRTVLSSTSSMNLVLPIFLIQFSIKPLNLKVIEYDFTHLDVAWG